MFAKYQLIDYNIPLRRWNLKEGNFRSKIFKLIYTLCFKITVIDYQSRRDEIVIGNWFAAF